MSEVPENIRIQYRNPKGEDGRTVLEGMNEHHSDLWNWGLSKMPETFKGVVMDVGCGGGGFIKRLSEKYTASEFIGVDISEKSLEVTSNVNRKLLEKGSLKLILAPVEELPMDDCSIDMVTAIETYFFWSDVPKALGRIHNVLAPGGMLFILSEMQLREDNAGEMERLSELYGTHLLTDEMMMKHMTEAGFETRCENVTENEWVIYIGIKS